MGKNTRGKQDGTGTYKNSARKTGVKKALGIKCPKKPKKGK